MPYQPARPCRIPGCPNLTNHRWGLCAEHLKQQETSRPSSTERGYDARWRKASRIYLQKHPLCVECEKAGRIKAATVVDHIIPHKGDVALFWDEDNWQPLCDGCHSSKTMKERGRADQKSGS
jgi:5-methylcytosine-specific restriction protein A